MATQTVRTTRTQINGVVGIGLLAVLTALLLGTNTQASKTTSVCTPCEQARKILAASGN